MKYLILLILLLTTMTIANGQWLKQNVNTTASLRGLSVVNEKVVWASGTGGTVIRTIDGGKTWNVIVVPGAEKLDFRDIEAFDENTAYILSIGNGDSSRIYKTTDGGQTWQLEFQNDDPKAFYDAIACFDRETCFAMSDPVDGKFVLIKRSPGVRSRVGIRIAKWLPIDNSALVAKPGEAAFAASGTCLITQGKNNLFLVTGGSDARVFRSNDRGQTWHVSETPIVKGTPGSGIFSIAMRDARNGVIVGGNYEKPTETAGTYASTNDGGKTWKLERDLSGYRSGVAIIDSETIVAVGATGADIRVDPQPVSGGLMGNMRNVNLNSIQAKNKNSAWTVGADGLVYRFIGQMYAM
jgi:YD repeat-containing protein